jgi:carbon monoxide dehydrogenase subunit G
MTIEEQFEVAAAIERVYSELNEVESIGYCVAGVKEVHVIDADRSRWRLEQRFGAIARTFDLDAEISEREPPNRLAFAAHGQDVTIHGHVALQALAPDRTGCDVLIQVDATGALGALLDIFARGPQRQLIRQTVTNLKAELEALAASDGARLQAAPEHVEEQPRGSWLRRWLGALLGATRSKT